MSGLLVLPPTYPNHSHSPQPIPPFGKLTNILSSRLCQLTPPSAPLNSHTISTSSGHKRKAEDDLTDTRMERTTPSPSPGPLSSARPPVSRPRQPKRPRTHLIGRQLALPRLLETLSPDQLRGVLRTICDQRPDIGSEIVRTAPRPNVSSALSVLTTYQDSLRRSFPYGDRPTSDYAYNRVRQALLNMIDALKDYTPHFLPPNEQQPSTSLEYLDGATNIVHHLPNWDSYQHNRHKQEAYEEMAQAWALVIREAAKKGGGIQLQYSGWDQKLTKHNQLSGGKMQEAISEIRSNLGWIDGTATGMTSGEPSADGMSIRQQLMSNTYGTNTPIQVGPW